MDLYNCNKMIRSIGKNLIDYYENNDHSILCGINGPYDDPETKIRNLCHLVIITGIEISKFGLQQYRGVLESMGEELLVLKGKDGLYNLREKKGKDSCNGVIGHAWVIEALIYLWVILKKETYLNEAVMIAKKHMFHYEIGLWGRPNMNGTDEAIDYTLNHQVWYAASLIELNVWVKDMEFTHQIDSFMKNLNKNLSISKYGKVSHSIYRRINTAKKIKYFIKRNVDIINECLNRKSMAYKEEGYHAFNFMALARIYYIIPNYDFFKSVKFNRAIAYMNSDKFLKGLINGRYELDQSLHNLIDIEEEKEVNIYGYPYNVPGFEILYIDAVFKNKISKAICNVCLEKQIKLTYDVKKGKFAKRCHDKNTINYRIYEYYRFMEVVI